MITAIGSWQSSSARRPRRRAGPVVAGEQGLERVEHARLVVDQQERLASLTHPRRLSGTDTVNVAPPPGAFSARMLAAVLLDDLVADREAEARALADRLGREERIEDAPDDSGAMPGPVSAIATTAVPSSGVSRS
jgi:hypothetical protein